MIKISANFTADTGKDLSATFLKTRNIWQEVIRDILIQ